MKNQTNAVIVADSIDNFKNRVTSFVLNVPQIIVKELLRHRMFSFSSSSMRAIPFKKVLKNIKEDMFIPLAYQSHHKGMQGIKYLTKDDAKKAREQWINSGLKACDEAKRLYDLGVTKQLCSRLIEPFGFAKILVTATEYNNFFELRCPKYSIEEHITFPTKKRFKYYYSEEKDWPKTDLDWYSINKSGAEIHIQALAEAMWDARNASKPKQLKAGEWHIPFGDKFDEDRITKVIKSTCQLVPMKEEDKIKAQWLREDIKVKIATARCARISYNNFEGKDDYAADIKLYGRLLANKHNSSFEHVCRVMTEMEYDMFIHGEQTYIDGNAQYYNRTEHKGWCRNLKGFINLRHIVENGNI